MSKYSFEDVYIKKKYGDATECNHCYGSGVVQYHDSCKKCDGKGFIIKGVSSITEKIKTRK